MGLGLIIGFLAALMGWQINLVAIHRGLHRHGKASAFRVGLGATLADALLVLLVFSGVHPFLHHPLFLGTAKAIGIISIVGVSLRMLFHRVPKTPKPDPAGAKDFFVGFFLVAGNPAIFILWIGAVGFLLVHFPQIQEWGFRFRFLGGLLLGSAGWFAVVAAFLLGWVRRSGEGSLHWISRVSAILLLCAAGLLFFHKF